MIKWSDGVSDEDSVYTAAAQLLMFAKLLQHYVDRTTPPRVVAVIQSLSQGVPQMDSLLKFAFGNKVDRNPMKCELFAVTMSRSIIGEIKRAHISKILGASGTTTRLSCRIAQEKKRAHSCKIWAQSSLPSHNKNANRQHTNMSPSDGQERNNGGVGWQYDA